MSKRWTEEEEKALKTLYPHFITGEISENEICIAMKRTRGGITNKADKMGLGKIIPTSLDLDLIASIKKRLKIKEI